MKILGGGSGNYGLKGRVPAPISSSSRARWASMAKGVIWSERFWWELQFRVFLRNWGFCGVWVWGFVRFGVCVVCERERGRVVVFEGQKKSELCVNCEVWMICGFWL